MRKITKKAVVILLGTTLFVGLLTGCKKSIGSYSHTDFAMGTVTNITLYGTDSSLNAIEESLIQRVKQVEDEEISWREEDSQLAKINENLKKNSESGTKTIVKEPLKSWLEDSLELSQDSYGDGRNTVDPSIGQLTTLWDFESESPKVPEKTKIQNAIRGLRENSSQITVKKDGELLADHTETKFDLGAFGKGIGIDEIQRLLEEEEDVSGAMAALGGSVLIYGEKPDGSAWNVGIQSPSGQGGDILGSVEVEGDTFISTSGDYEKYFIDKTTGKKYFHILDVKTGYSVESDITSCTIVCDSGLNSDGLSTACFALGVEGSKELLKKYDAKAVFVDKKKNIYVSDGLDFTLQDESYNIVK